MRLFANLFKSRSAGAEASRTITIVSGLLRSGTSMIMKMPAAGGLLVLADAIRQPDEDNPEEHYEFERVKALPRRGSCLAGGGAGEGGQGEVKSQVLCKLSRRSSRVQMTQAALASSFSLRYSILMSR
jgi:hypothetical protein